MGITGLLPLMKPVSKRVHIREFSGKTVAIDGYSWIHKGVYGSGLAIFEGKDVDAHVTYCLKKLAILLEAGVRPIIVFDGGRLPIKAHQEEERRLKREEARQVVSRALKNKDRRMAWEYANRCIDVTPAMVTRLAIELQKQNIQYIVAPYEADAQMAFLVKNGIADAVISEDSDMLPFGCSKVIFKLAPDGTGDLIQVKDIASTPSFKGFTQTQFRQTCILSGCDYLPSLPKLGLGTAIRLMQTHKSIEAIFRALKSPSSSYNFETISTYEKGFLLADLTFSHQRIWNPNKKCIEMMEPITNIGSLHIDLINAIKGDENLSLLEEWPFPVENLSFLGPPVNDLKIAEGIACGIICPISMVPLNSGLLPLTNLCRNSLKKQEHHHDKKEALVELSMPISATSVAKKTPWLSRLSLRPLQNTSLKENIPPEAIKIDPQELIGESQMIADVTIRGTLKKSPYFEKKTPKRSRV